MNKQYKNDFLHAGRLAKETRAYGKSLIQKGACYQDVISKVYAKIAELGAIPAFPPQIALNDVAAHFLPEPGQDIFFTDQIVKLDIGICYKGAIGDCAVTVDLSEKNQGLIDAAEAALLQAEQIIKVGLPVREIGKVIEETIASYGYTSIKNLSGHGLGYYKIHTAPNIPNYYDRSTAVVKAGMTFAIEPFATNGVGFIYDAGSPMIFSLLRTFPKSFQVPPLLKEKVHSFQGLPFSMQDLISTGCPLPEVQSFLNHCMENQIIAGYGALVEEAHGWVAQAENSVLVDEDGHVTISTR